MRYARILGYVASGVWAIEEVKGYTILAFLVGKAAGGVAAWDDDETPEERRERIERRKQEAAERQQEANGGVAVLPLYGIISPRAHDVEDQSSPGGVSAEGFARAFRQLAADPQVTGIVIDGDSPGGNALGIAEAWAAIREAKGSKPVAFVANHLAASAAYWIASAADEIVVTPSGQVGSIGVMSYHEDISKMLELRGIKPTLVRVPEFKGEQHEVLPLTEEARGHMQARVDDYYAMFVRDVAKGRGVSRDTVREGWGKGRMVGADEAVRLGMVDRIDSLDNTVRRIARAGSKPKAVAAEEPAPALQSLRRRLAVT